MAAFAGDLGEFDLDFVDEDITDAFPSLLPLSAAGRDVLLLDDDKLMHLCEEYYGLVRGISGIIGFRVAGRVVAEIHRELSLPIPDEEVLFGAMMSHARVSTYDMDREGFVAFLDMVLRQCLQGDPLSGPSPAPACTDAADTTDFESFGSITVHVHKLDGTDASVVVNDFEPVEKLQDLVQEHLGVPKVLQRLMHGSTVLEPRHPMFSQGVVNDSTIMVIRHKPQATLLRIRRVNLGDDVRASSKPTAFNLVPAFTPAVDMLAFNRHEAASSTATAPHPDRHQSQRYSLPNLTAVSMKAALISSDPFGKPNSTHDAELLLRKAVPDVRIRRCNLGRV